MPLGGPMRRGRRRGLIVGAAVGSAAARHASNNANDAAQAAAPSGDDQMAQLEKLGQLHTDGVLTDEEFAAKKKEILGL